MKLKIAHVIGLNTDQKAAQVISTNINEDYFFAVLILSCDDAFTKGRQILSELSDFYFDLEEGTFSERLTETFEESKKKLSSDDFSILIASVSGKVLYLESKGDVLVYLKRGDKISPLNLNAQNQLISGFLEENDRLLFATQSLITFLKDDLEQSLLLPVDAFEEEVADRVGASNIDDQGLAGLLAEVLTDEVEEKPKVLESENLNIKTKQEEDEDKSMTNLDQIDAPTYQSYSNSEDSKKSPLKIVGGIIKSIIGFLWGKRKHFPKSNRGRLILAVILIVIIGIGIGFEIKAKKDAKLNSDFNVAMQSSKDFLNAAKGLSTLNPKDSKGKLDQAKDEVNKAIALKPNNIEAQSLKKEIEDSSATILQQTKVSELPVFLDLDLVKKNFRPTQMSLSTGKILLLDPNLKSLVSIDISKKSNSVLAGSEQLGDALFASINGSLAFVYSSDKGIVKVDTSNQKASIVSKIDEDWGKISDIYSFGGNIYILDSVKNQIWKYLPTSTGYSDKREYLTKDIKADFADSLRMQIESSVYILKSGGEILRFTKGDKDNFSYEGIPSSVKDPKSFFVSSDTDNLYLLDSGNSRLLILTKTGGYKGEISGDKLREASDLVVDEQGKKVYLLEGSKIYTLDLK